MSVFVGSRTSSPPKPLRVLNRYLGRVGEGILNVGEVGSRDGTGERDTIRKNSFLPGAGVEVR